MTGYPFVDAGMRELAATGWMHNRARMVVASFLAKDLHLDWRAGERWFMRCLVDGEPASNNGGWQWAASTGTERAALVPGIQSDRPGRALRPPRRVRPAVDSRARGAERNGGAPPLGCATRGRALSRAHRRPPARARRRPRPLPRRPRGKPIAATGDGRGAARRFSPRRPSPAPARPPSPIPPPGRPRARARARRGPPGGACSPPGRRSPSAPTTQP